ncbi:AAA family ATPase [Patescibacteria group bacterium]|nr:AAA family ATPase [Patescibacteria group bacterium]
MQTEKVLHISKNVKKIYIIGLPGSGKTTLALKLSKRLHLKHVQFDYLFKVFGNFGNRKYRALSEKEYMPKVYRVLKNYKNWVIEGGKLTEEVVQVTDMLIFVHIPIYKSVLRIIKRYFVDKHQREVYGLAENIILIRKTIQRSPERMKQYKKLTDSHSDGHIISNKSILKF